MAQSEINSPAVYGAVTASTAFTLNGQTYVARGLWSDDDGTIDVLMADGTAMSDKMIFKGMNVFRVSQVTDVNGRTLEWFA